MSIKVLPERIEFYAHGELIAAHNRCFGRQQNIYQMAHYLPLLERKGRAIFQAKPVRDNVSKYFLDWLTRQALKPKELVALLERSMEIGVDAVMRGEVPTVPAPISEIHDFVQISAVDLSAYDRLCHTCKEAII